MSKFTKHICVLLTIAIIAGCMVLSSFALDRSETISFGEETLNNYVLNEVGKYIGMSEEIIDENAEYSVSNAYTVVGSSNSELRIFFTFKNSQCIGQFNVVFENGKYNGTYFGGNLSIVTEELENQNPFALYYSNNRLYLMDSKSSYVLRGQSESDPIFLSVLEKKELSLHTVKFSINKTTYSPMAATYKLLQVPIMPAEKTPLELEPSGLCWAVSVASIIRYKKSPNYSNLIGADVYIEVANYLAKNNVKVEGEINSKYVKEAFEAYDVPMSFKNSGISFYTVKNHINANKPIYAGISVQSNRVCGHAIVVCGYEENNDGQYFYTVMDCNSKKYGIIEVNDPNSTNFTYVAPDSTTFSYWNRTFW